MECYDITWCRIMGIVAQANMYFVEGKHTA